MSLNATEPNEEELRSRFAVREEIFEHRGFHAAMLMPRAADELLDEEAFARDERMPYWADLWPSARALAAWILNWDGTTHNARVVELGCGLALPSLALLHRGGSPVATDFNADGLAFARVNAMRNRLGELDARMVDWRDWPAELRPFDLVLAADVLYEERNAVALAALLPRIVAATGQVVLADPGRRWLSVFERLMRERGFAETRREAMEVVREAEGGKVVRSSVTVAVWEREEDSA